MPDGGSGLGRRRRLELYCEQLQEFRDRLASDDPAVSAAANRDYEFCAGKPGFASQLMAIAHVSTARACLRYADKLNDWEREFLGSIVRLHLLSPKQRAKLSAIAARVL
jgi:hypothetical protein